VQYGKRTRNKGQYFNPDKSIHDFLAYGNAALGILDLIKQSGANLVGMGFIIEKAFHGL